MYNNELHMIVDLHAPVVTHYIKTEAHPRWNKQCQDVSTARRKVENYAKNLKFKKQGCYTSNMQ